MSHINEFLVLPGALVLFLIAYAEQSGLPFPGAPWLLAAGAMAASGRINLFTAIFWASRTAMLPSTRGVQHTRADEHHRVVGWFLREIRWLGSGHERSLFTDGRQGHFLQLDAASVQGCGGGGHVVMPR